MHFCNFTIFCLMYNIYIMMQTLCEMYKIGKGPSSSHTVGPFRIVKKYIKYYPDVDKLRVHLYGSLAITGKGHHTDLSIESAADGKKVEIVWDYTTKTEHPNTLKIEGFEKDGKPLPPMIAFSIGGGSILIKNDPYPEKLDVYPHTKFAQVSKWCTTHKKNLVEYVKHFDKQGYKHLTDVWKAMKKTVIDGINDTEPFNGPIKIEKKANIVMKNIKKAKLPKDSMEYVMAYGYAVAEQNVLGKDMVTSPTLGSAGIIPAVLYYANVNKKFSESKIIEALAVAGVIGNCYKLNGSVAGATGGCQAEIGVSCSMAAAAYCYLLGGNLQEIEIAAIIAMEHHLGLTCDPLLGYVYIPCIERNATIAPRAISAAHQSLITNGRRNVFSLDDIVDVEKCTGSDLKDIYRETSLGGLAKIYEQRFSKKQR